MGRGAAAACLLGAFAILAGAALWPMPAAASSTPKPTPRSSATTSPQAVAQSSAVTAGGAWSWQSPAPSGEPLFAVNCPTMEVCYAAGALGSIELTTDRGQTWTDLNTGVSDAIAGISCFNNSTCVAVDTLGQAIRTTNEGASWTSVSINGGKPLNAISCSPENPAAYPEECLAAGDGGVILHSDNYGAGPWARVFSGVTQNLYGISCWAWSRCVVAGAGGTIRLGANDGKTWSAVSSGVSSDLFAVSCQFTGDPTSTPACAAAGQSGAIVSGSGATTTWSASQLPGVAPNLLGVDCNSTCLVTGDDGFVYSMPSLDWNGVLPAQPWAGASTTAAGGLNAITCTGLTSTGQRFLAFQCMAVGDYSTVVGTVNHGSAWYPRPPAPANGFGPIACASTAQCVAVANPPNAAGGFTTCSASAQCSLWNGGGSVAYTNNGGATWPVVPLAGSDIVFSLRCPSTTLCIGVGPAGEAVTSADGGHTWSALTTGQTVDLYSLSCPAATTCFAAGNKGTIITTVDGGAHWTALTTGTTLPLNSISCPTATTCFVAVNTWAISPTAGEVLSTTDGGTTWTTTAVSGYWQSIDCPATTTCYLAGGANLGLQTVMVSTDGGVTWVDHSPAKGTFTSLGQIICPAASTCYLMGGGSAVFFTTDGGLHWTSTNDAGVGSLSCPTASTCFTAGPGDSLGTITNTGTTARGLSLEGAGNFTDVTCPSPTLCYAVSTLNNNGVVSESVDGGRDWFGVFGYQNFVPEALSCPSISTCYVVGPGPFSESLVVSTTDSGVSWTVGGYLRATVTRIECPNTTTCYASASNPAAVYKTTNGGANWSSAASPAAFSDVSCPSATTCYGSGTVLGSPNSAGVWKSTDGAGTWSLAFNLSSDPNAGVTAAQFSAIACPSLSTCYTVGPGGAIATTTDGVNWRTDGPPASIDFSDVSCPTAGTCFASGPYVVDHTTNFGGTWEQQVAATTGNTYRALSCPTTAVCVAVGDVNLIGQTTGAGQEWAPVFPADTTSSVASISCPNASDCFAAANDTLLATHDGGANWAQQKLTTTDQMVGMSCPSTTTCFSVGWPGAIYRSTDGVSWVYEQNPISGADQTLTSVSCPTTTWCVGVGTQGYVVATIDGVSWTAAQSVPINMSLGAPLLLGVSCPVTGFCVAVARQGQIFVLNSGAWTASPSGVTSDLVSVSCPSTSVCYVVGRSGVVLTTTNGGASWNRSASGVTDSLRSVSCPELELCLAVGDQGTLIYTSDGATWSTAPAPTLNHLFGAALLPDGHAWIGGAGGSILANPNLLAQPWNATYDLILAPTTWNANQTQTFSVTVTNTGNQAWLHSGANPVELDMHFATNSGNSTSCCWLTNQAFALPSDVAPGGSLTVSVSVTAPNTGGSMFLEAEMFKSGQFWFPQWQPDAVTVAPPTWTASYTMGPPTSWVAGQTQAFDVTVSNTGNQTWRHSGPNPVELDMHFSTSNGGSTSCCWLTNQTFLLPSDLAPGDQATVTVTVTAPSQAGSLYLEAEMFKSGQFWFNQWDPVAVTVSPAVWSASYSMSPPTSWVAGQSQSVTVTITNTGNVTWLHTGANPVELDMHFSSSNGGSTSCCWLTNQTFLLPSDVAPGASIMVTVLVTAASQTGSLFLEAEMFKSGQFWFNQWDPVAVTVAAALWSADYVMSPPTTWTAGQSQSVTVTIKNTGNVTWLHSGANPVELDMHFSTSNGGSTSCCWLTSQVFVLPSDVAPGASITMTVMVSAPSRPGSLYLEAEMFKSGQFWFTTWAFTAVTVS